MSFLILALSITTTILPCLAQENPPTVNVSYKAMGELVENLPDTEVAIMQLAFEEHYDSETQNAAFTVWELGDNVTFIEDGMANQTIRYDRDTECKVITKQDYVNVDSPPSLIGYNLENGKIRFSLRMLFDLDNKYLIPSAQANATTYRGIPAKSWEYGFEGMGPDDKTPATVAVFAYWSDGTWNTTSKEKQVPLGYKIVKNSTAPSDEEPVVHEQYINVFGFLHGVVDKKAFRPREGVYCKGRTHPNKMPIFPDVKALTLRSEFILPDYQEIKTMDVYYDITNKLLRVDLDRIDSQDSEEDMPKNSRRFTSQTTSKNLGATFRFDIFQSAPTCTVYAIKDYNFDPQEIINPKLDPEMWSLDYLLGRNTTDYVYTGKTIKRNIPCYVFQGIRKDWPDESGTVTSLWDWCLAANFSNDDDVMNFRDKEIGIVSVTINITESSNSDFPVNFRMIHHFYDVLEEDPHSLSVNGFDLTRCFSRDQRRNLQFQVDVKITDDNLLVIENATSDVTFLRLWRTSIADSSNILVTSLRITQMQATVFQKKLFILFTLLDIHKDLPEESKKGQPSLKEAEDALKDAISKKQLSIDYKPSAKAEAMTLTALDGTLTPAVDRITDFTPRSTVPETTTPKPTIPHITLITDEITSSETGVSVQTEITRSSPFVTEVVTSESGTITSSTKVQPTTEKPLGKQETILEGNQPGAVAGVAVAMLLIGVTAGAGGTFYRYRGLPCRS